MIINNKLMVLLQLIVRILIVLFPVLLLFYLEYYWFFGVSVIIFCIVVIKLIFSARCLMIKVTSDKISVKELSLLNREVPVRFLKVAIDEISEFYMDDKHKKMSFHIDLHTKSKVISFSTKYFTQNQKSKLTDTVSRYIYN